MLAAFGSKIPKNDWVQSFTSSDSDVLHDAHGVVSSTASNLNRGSDFDSRYKSLVATHHFKKFNQAKAFHDKFTSGTEPPFDQSTRFSTTSRASRSRSSRRPTTRRLAGSTTSSRRERNFERNEVTRPRARPRIQRTSRRA